MGCWVWLLWESLRLCDSIDAWIELGFEEGDCFREAIVISYCIFISAIFYFSKSASLHFCIAASMFIYQISETTYLTDFLFTFQIILQVLKLDDHFAMFCFCFYQFLLQHAFFHFDCFKLARFIAGVQAVVYKLSIS